MFIAPGKPKYSFSAFAKPADLQKGIVIVIKAFDYIVSRKSYCATVD